MQAAIGPVETVGVSACNALSSRSSREVVRLISSWLERALVEAESVVGIASVSPLGVRDPRTDLIRVAEDVERRIVRRLEVVVNQATLFLLAKCEVVALQLGHQVQISLLLLFSILKTTLSHVLLLGLRGSVLGLAIGANSDVGALELGTDLASIGSLSTLSGLCIDLTGVHRLIASF